MILDVVNANHPDDSNDQYVVISESYQGQYSGEIFPNKDEAYKHFEALLNSKVISDDLPVDRGFLDSEWGLHRLLPLKDAFGINGKLVWVVSHKCFLSESYGKFDWVNYYETREEAKDSFDFRANLYHEQAKSLNKVKIEEDDEQMLIFIDEKPIVYLDYLPKPIGISLNEGSVVLSAFCGKD